MSTIQHIHFDTIDSTHSWTKKHAATLDPSAITCITADTQTSGIGRHQKQWISPPHQNICTTLFFCLPTYLPYITNLGQILALSCADLLIKEGLSPQFKWPNDILIDYKKIAGVLCETVTLPERVGIVLSIGLNVNMPQQQLDAINQPATSLLEAVGKIYDLTTLLNDLTDIFVHHLAVLQEHGFIAFADQYESRLAYRGQTISCSDGVHRREGICQGITEDGRLKLLLADGTLLLLFSSEIIA